MERNTGWSSRVALLLLCSGCALLERTPFAAAVPYSCYRAGEVLRDTVAFVNRLSHFPAVPAGIAPGLAANRPWAPGGEDSFTLGDTRYRPFGNPIRVSSAVGADSAHLLHRVAEIGGVPVYVAQEDLDELRYPFVYLPLTRECLFQPFRSHWERDQIRPPV